MGVAFLLPGTRVWSALFDALKKCLALVKQLDGRARAFLACFFRPFCFSRASLSRAKSDEEVPDARLVKAFPPSDGE